MDKNAKSYGLRLCTVVGCFFFSLIQNLHMCRDKTLLFFTRIPM